jgi:hypothetical protein
VSDTPVVEISVSINGEQVFGLFAENRGLMCDEEDRELVWAGLAEALTMLLGVRPRPEIDAVISVRRAAPAQFLSIVRKGSE